MHPRSIFVIELLPHEVVDLTTAGQLGVTARLGAEAIRWPSATGAGQSVAVFIDQLRPASHADVVRSFDLTHDAVNAIDAGTSVTTLISALNDAPLVELGAISAMRSPRAAKESSRRRCPVDGARHEPSLHRHSSAR